jgi:tetratricopeptide (TPR) repeat protein
MSGPGRLTLLLFCLTFIAVCVWVALSNPEVLARELVLPLPFSASVYRLSVGHGLLVAFGLGTASVFLLWGSHGIGAMFTAVAQFVSTRGQRQVARAHERGVEAVLNGQLDVAMDAFEQVLAKSPDHAATLMAGADTLRRLGRAQAAVQWRQRRLETAPTDHAALLGLADDLRAQGDRAGAITALEKLVSLRPRRASAAALRLRDLLVEAGAHEKALAVHEKLCKMEGAPTGPDEEAVRAGLMTRAAVERARGGAARAAEMPLRKVVQKHPGYAPAYVALFEALVLDGREEDALDTLVQGWERTSDPTLLVAAEDHYLTPGEDEDGDGIARADAALSAFRRLAASAGDRALATAFLARLLARFEMLDEAATCFDAVRDEVEASPTLLAVATRVTERQGDVAGAAARYREILDRLGVLAPRHACRACGARAPEAVDRCEGCGRWGTVTVDLGLPRGPREGLAQRPMFAVPTDDHVVSEDALA